MGSKVHPTGFRLGNNKNWKSVWFNEKNYSDYLHEDEKIRNYLKSNYGAAGISEILIERPSDSLIRIDIYSARLGILIGRKGAEIKKIRDDLKNIVGDKNVKIYAQEVKNPYVDAQLIAEDVSGQLQRRVSHKVAMKKAITNAMRRGAKGVKIMVSGRLGGAEIARTEWYMEGRLPLQTLRSNIDYAVVHSQTKYGTIGIKVWVYDGDTPLK
ncbi:MULTISPECIES: 30S ribosomal protein S3 [Petrotoga]|uniref:Small ribosomal subunit protein uS3 n=2 Tax=Petrotoga sibirica TaxID=156202 RepID=A0A4R8EST3_9BACT|nr:MULTISPECIES: 30S ribosomal protein S3 [Petrotoga]POZ88914.1 30S ribosomal protein S3 [Petrotoga sibirica DSM 13575]POZ91151.1 30S ribosomal protein S3 [Petrotoga sp. SL27]TDX15572.1 SSU ribosomal protein S3P [Petrotoga sibirica]